jgi:hypothetical protein
MNKQKPVCGKCRDENKTAYERGTWRLYICNDCFGSYEKAWFSVAGMPAMELLHDPTDLWNGWNNPKFNFEQAQLFIDWTNAPEQKTTWRNIDNPERFSIVDGQIFCTYTGYENETDVQEIKAEEIDGVKYYGIGNWAWVWQACKTENEANEVW